MLFLFASGHQDAGGRAGVKKKGLDLTTGDGWAELKSFAFGELGLRPIEYYDLTVGELLLTRQGYERRLVNDIRYNTRTIVHTMARMWGDSKKVPSRAEEFWPLPGDDAGMEIEDDELTRAQREFFAQRELFAGKSEKP